MYNMGWLTFSFYISYIGFVFFFFFFVVCLMLDKRLLLLLYTPYASIFGYNFFSGMMMSLKGQGFSCIGDHLDVKGSGLF